MCVTTIQFARLLKKHRKLKNMSQQVLADLLNVHRTMIVYYEQGKYAISLQTALKASKILDFNLNEIYDEEKGS